MKEICTLNAPQPAGRYAQAIEQNGLVFVSGLLPVNAHSGEKCLEEIEEQAEVVWRNLDAILQAAGNSPDDVLKMTVYISDITLWGRVNAV